MTSSGTSKVAPNVLISSAGRRVSLLRAFQNAVGPMGGHVVATDMSRFAPALLAADHRRLVPKISDPIFIETMIGIVQEYEIGLLVPTLDTELPVLAASAGEFAALGCRVAVASPEAISTCADKVATYEWFLDNDIPTVRQASPSELMKSEGSANWPWPLIVKPARGSASNGVRLLSGPESLAGCSQNDIVQTIAPGEELTIDVYVDLSGVPRVAIPRRRIEVRAGEVSKAVTVHHPKAEQLAMRIASLLPGAFGAVTVQLFADGDELNVIEINPRFGGGYPLSWHAGARFPEWMIAEILGNEPHVGRWTEGLCMLRYDDAMIAMESDLP